MSASVIPLSELALGPIARVTGSGHVRLRTGILRGAHRIVAKEVSLTRAAREGRSATAAARLIREARMLAAANPHASVVQSFGMYEGTRDDDDDMVLGLVTREAPGGSLKTLLRDCALDAGSRARPLTTPALPLPWRLTALRDVARALAHAHALGMAHGDVKPGNVLVGDGGGALLADFDCAAFVGASADGSSAGSTLEYCAPEMLLAGGAGTAAAPAADCYAFAMLAFELLEAKPLHHGVLAYGSMVGEGALTRPEFAAAVVDGLRPSFSDRASPSDGDDDDADELRALVEASWHADPAARPPAARIAAALEDVRARAVAARSRPQLWRIGGGASDDAAAAADADAAADAPGLKVGCASARGRRPSMEDRTVAFCTPAGDAAVAAVFDGHGGTAAAQFAAARLPSLLPNALDGGSDGDGRGAAAAAERAVRALAADVRAELGHAEDGDGAPARACGSTATVVVADAAGGGLGCAWLGDSGAALCRAPSASGGPAARMLTSDHRPDRDDERARVEAAGGAVGRRARVRDDGVEEPYGPYRCYGADGRGGLAVSRALGDLALAAGGVLSDAPEVVAAEARNDAAAEDGGAFVLVASDGVWDVLPPDDAAGIAWDGGGAGGGGWCAQRASEAVVAAALARGTQDNVAAAVLDVR